MSDELAIKVEGLKKVYGDSLSFWGTVGSQRLFSFGNPSEVQDEVRRRIEGVGGGGGFIASPAYDTHSDVPLRNIEAFFEAVDRYGLY